MIKHVFDTCVWRITDFPRISNSPHTGRSTSARMTTTSTRCTERQFLLVLWRKHLNGAELGSQNYATLLKWAALSKIPACAIPEVLREPPSLFLTFVTSTSQPSASISL